MPKKKSKLRIPETFIHEFVRPEGFKDIVRVADTDIPGEMAVLYALTRVLGIGISLANAIIKKTKVNPRALLGTVDDETIGQLNEIIRNPLKFGIPHWLVNRPHDRVTGEHRHLIGSTLTLQIKRDIERMINLGAWKGTRHSKGLKARGQRLGRTRPYLIIHHLKR
ncbi:MAG: 30S ribosomal protein S13 [Candidatus Njordarchaeota archaeon]